ncbi:MAG: cytochrome-c peroxidase [Bacteroidetes bacterium]|nr:cytochrome-c peroxidase [Bacteroidota bacterium]
MKNLHHVSIILVAIAMTAWACQKDNTEASLPTPDLSQSHDYLNMKLPANISPFINLAVSFPNYNNSENPLTNDGATLGRVLFYDGHLSKNNLISCGSCHVQAKGFADPVAFSTGFKFGKTTRNSMSIANMSLQRNYFWDRRASNLEEQVMMPVQNHVEMGIEKLGVLPQKLAQVPYYPALFEAAFGDEQVTEERISFALAQYLRSMVSGNSRYDEGIANDFSNFTELEKMGMQLFTDWNSRAGCANCHGGVLFDGWNAENIGLDEDYTDLGEGDGRFKVPSLRNVAVTAPYMHDGRFNTLEEVVEHYNSGVKMNSGLSWALIDSTGQGARRLHLTDFEKKALVAFLKTLTDEQYLKDPKFSDPFR